MLRFLRSNGVELVIALLMLILTGIGGYFVRKSEALENRIWVVETRDPEIRAEIISLNEKMDRMDRQMAELKKDLIYEINSQCSHIRELISEKGDLKDAK